MNKYITLFALAALANIECEAQPNTAVPRLVVGITIDQLNSNDMEHFAALYGNGGFKKLLNEGVVYENAQYDFAPVNLASASTAIATGASPTDNGITAERWISRETLRPVGCTFDKKLMVSPNNVMASTIGDEMKMARMETPSFSRWPQTKMLPFCTADTLPMGCFGWTNPPELGRLRPSILAMRKPGSMLICAYLNKEQPRKTTTKPPVS